MTSGALYDDDETLKKVFSNCLNFEHFPPQKSNTCVDLCG